MDGTNDAELVARVIGGEPGAFAELYDRYADRIHDLCLHMLRDSHDAADATADVFLAASDHLDQLRDPTRLRSWLYAIARNEVYRRTRSRKRETVMDASSFTDLPAASDADESADPAAMAALVREASLGLDERDRLVLEMTLAGGLDGRELGDALGLGENAAHQATHRMRERLGRSIGALLVARQGREECEDLAALLSGWDGSFSVLWRKRVARHVDGCETCEASRRKVPAAVLGGTAFASPMLVAFVGPPPGVRERVLGAVGPGGSVRMGAPRGGSNWRPDGFPPVPGDRERTRALAAVAAGLVLFLAVVAGVVAWSSGDDAQLVAVDARAPESTTTTPDDGTTTSVPTSPALGPGSTTAVAAAPTAPGVPTTVASSPTTTRPGRVVTPPPTTTPPATPATTTTAAPATTTTTTAAPQRPTLTVAVPPLHSPGECPPNPDIVATTSSNIGSVSMTWTSANAGTGTLFFTKVSPTSWTRSWQPPQIGSYTLQFSATTVGTSPVTITRNQTVYVDICIR